MITNMNSTISALTDIDRAIDVLQAEELVPSGQGLYAIFIRDIDSLPGPMKDYQLARKQFPKLIYIGKATGKGGLILRLVSQDLQHRGKSTFFRSIGAGLGYRPIPGSLMGRKNQTNYEFSEEDTKEIRNWINQNLLVTYAELSILSEKQIEEQEKAIIDNTRAVCNIKHNPKRLKWLEDVREECRRIARGGI